MFENPRRGRQARNFTTNVPKILDLKSSSEQIFFRKSSLGAPEVALIVLCLAFSSRNLYIQVEVSHKIIMQNLRCKQPVTGNWKTANGFACFSFGLFVCLFNTFIIFPGV